MPNPPGTGNSTERIVIAIIKQVRAATGPISPSSNVECLDTAHFFPDCSLAAPMPNVLPFCL